MEDQGERGEFQRYLPYGGKERLPAPRWKSAGEEADSEAATRFTLPFVEIRIQDLSSYQSRCAPGQCIATNIEWETVVK